MSSRQSERAPADKVNDKAQQRKPLNPDRFKAFGKALDLVLWCGELAELKVWSSHLLQTAWLFPLKNKLKHSNSKVTVEWLLIF